MARIAAVILAGGKGERLGGVNKATLRFGGARLVDRAIAATAAADRMVIAAGSNAIEGVTATVIGDLPTDYAGPLAGLAAAVQAMLAEPPVLCVTMAVDTPFFPADFIERGCALIGDFDAVLGAFGGQAYPTNALWRFDRIAGLPQRVRDGSAPHSLKRLAAELQTRVLDYAGLAADNPFANINTPAELDALRRRQGAA